MKRRKARERSGLFVAEGVRCVEELTRSALAIHTVLVAPQLGDAPRGTALLSALSARGVPVTEVGEREFVSAADTESPQGVLAIAAIPQRELDALSPSPAARILVLDAVQDPGNVGTIVRTAAALGALATIALPGTVDLWNAKVVRSAMGAQFHHPAFSCTWDDLDAFLARSGTALWGADPAGEPLRRGESVITPLGIVLGNEGTGLGADAMQRVSRRIALPIAPSVESLNVAVAAGILLYELRA